MGKQLGEAIGSGMISVTVLCAAKALVKISYIVRRRLRAKNLWEKWTYLEGKPEEDNSMSMSGKTRRHLRSSLLISRTTWLSTLLVLNPMSPTE